MNKLRLILGDQLNINHSWFKENNSNTTYVMMEVKEETSYVLHHAQKIIATFAAMRFLLNNFNIKGLKLFILKLMISKISIASTKTLIKLSKKKI